MCKEKYFNWHCCLEMPFWKRNARWVFKIISSSCHSGSSFISWFVFFTCSNERASFGKCCKFYHETNTDTLPLLLTHCWDVVFLCWKFRIFKSFVIIALWGCWKPMPVYRSALNLQYPAPNTPTSAECVLAIKRELEFVQAGGKEILQD